MSNSLIDRTIGFPLGSVAETENAFVSPLGEGLFSYSRRENPTVSDCERTLAEVEKSRWCLLATSGMAAINVVLSIFNDSQDRRPWLFPADVYSGTSQYATEVLQNQRGVDVRFAEPAGGNASTDTSTDTTTTENLISAIEAQSPGLVFIEPISNPLLDIIDLQAVLNAARACGARVVVDNTFATPYLLNPLEMGADVVLHSATKYLAGHNNILAGAICVDDADLHARLIMHRNIIGAVLSPDDAGRLKTQLATFSLRVAQQNKTAQTIAEFLDGHAGVAFVRYPGLPSHRQHELAQSMFNQRGFGALITFDLARDENDSTRFVDDLSGNIPHIGSLGDVTTSFLHVKACFAENYHHSTIRLSVGIEPAEQIIAHLQQALGEVSV